MDERIKFVGRLLNGEKMSVLCREFGISQKAGYKFFNRYKIDGVTRLEDQARRPCRHANRLPCQVEKTILSIKREFPSGGAPKIRDKILNEFSAIKPPAIGTVCTLSLTATAWSNAKSTPAPSSRGSILALERSLAAFGLSASWIMIQDSLIIWRTEWSPWGTTHSLQNCYLCLRNEPHSQMG